MKWGTLYGPHYVNRLARGVKRHLSLPHRFVCFTDDPEGLESGIEAYPLPQLKLPSGHDDLRWRKLALFNETLFDLTGTALFLDLDLVITGNLDPFFQYPGIVPMIRDDDLFRRKPLRKLRPERDRFLSTVGNSSVFRYEIGSHAYVVEEFCQDPASAQARYSISQQFQSAVLMRHGALSYWPREWCVSFKNDCVPGRLSSFFRDPKLPTGARIVVFAGTPKMDEVMQGGGQRWYRRIGDVGWLRQAWECEA